MAELTLISPADLLLDAENPRLPQPNVGQREALRSLAQQQDRYLLNLANDIVLHGLNPTELPLVMPSGDNPKRYLVLEGNRRLAALRALENPDTLSGVIAQSTLSELRKLGREYQKNPVDAVRCVVVKEKDDEALHWIEIRHTGRNEGAGLIPWGSDEAARFRARTGKREPHTQALDFLSARGHLTPEARRKVPAASFKRLINSPRVREKLGVGVEGGELRLLADERRVAKALMHVVNDLTSGKTRTQHIYTKEQRAEYADTLPADIVVQPVGAPRHVPEKGTTETKTKRAPPPKLKPRDNLIPNDCTLAIAVPRIKEIEEELRTLSLESYTNAVSVLFRVFVELSADSYLTKRRIPEPADARLSKKLHDSLSDLLAQQKLTERQAVPVRRACQKDSLLAPSVNLLHQYVHNNYVFPGPGDLRAAWNGLQPFMAAIWSP